ncbi:3-deoxy-manno-octulosonate cytidylyltransferase [Bdellovibrio bacteriovorus]|uniref:3-deoxy-manno-octulosonate cytidylyltransferase n=1 Tax=Bdellovibrio bacteriovorus TaxID=959 RepID=A0A150WSC9_BDEBC|nr:3-deoxy-manno-octulosonate cytidylyltransferase [Bdellovibrio bacteriovorus]KYG67362.1 3-deoxy-manno-octulosonate cytidylyltransferase [Bdellovibrio bacteriovorus]
MKILGVIPARFGSTRFPGKPLVSLQGRPLIQWTLEGAKKSKLLSDVIVATDDERIKKAVEDVGGKVVMTASELPTGSDRIHAAIQGLDCDVVVNIQGDEPLVTGELVDRLAQVFIDEPNMDMATLAHPISDEELQSPNSVKVVLNHNDEALYFSRYAIPYSRNTVEKMGSREGCLKHIGMYAYSKKFLKKFCEAPPAFIENAESLEQLRALYLGAKIKVIRVKEASLGVDTPEDLARLEKLLSQGR